MQPFIGLSKVLSQWEFSQVATGNERMRVRHRFRQNACTHSNQLQK